MTIGLNVTSQSKRVEPNWIVSEVIDLVCNAFFDMSKEIVWKKSYNFFFV